MKPKSKAKPKSMAKPKRGSRAAKNKKNTMKVRSSYK
jgi:hypothetical protein